MKKFMGRVVSIVLLTGLLAGLSAGLLPGCTGTPAQNTGQTPAVSEKGQEATGTNEPKPGVEETEALWPRTYVDALGNEVLLEKQPERVVSVFHAMYPDYLYSLGVSPVGVAVADAQLSKWAAYHAYTASQTIVDIGGTGAPSLERILELEPDLILAIAMHEEIYESLAQIAPTVILDYSKINLDWKYGLEEFSKLLGKEAQVSEVIASVEETVAAAAAKLADFRAQGESVIFISITEKNIWPYSVSQLQIVYDEASSLGLKAPETYPIVTDRSEPISLEALAEHNPDHIFVMVDPNDETAKYWLEELNSNSVWASISAVKNNRLYLTDRSLFAFNAPIATGYGANFVVECLIPGAN